MTDISTAKSNGNERIEGSRLRRRIVRELNRQGYHLRSTSFSRNGESDKDFIRARHARQRKDRLTQEFAFIARKGSNLMLQFAVGSEITPELISPELVPVLSESAEAELFRFASMLWSVPISRGFGRRMRYLVRDRQNGKLIGIFALGDPVFNLTARDEWIGWTVRDREKRLVNVMDAYVLGAVPPYNSLLCGKLVASLATSKQVTDDFRRKYGESTGVISGERKNASLALVTTTSALGRSSLYNRLTLPDGIRFECVGRTKGYGHFHLPTQIFQDIKEFMTELDHPYAHGHRFGNGPNWRLRLIRAALKKLNINEEVMRHGITREVYVAALARNAATYLKGHAEHLRAINWDVREISEYCLGRWIIPRAHRDGSYREVTRSSIAAQMADGSRRVEQLLLNSITSVSSKNGGTCGTC